MAINPISNNEFKNILLATNPMWQSHITRWQFLINSYLGGQDFRDGKYLTAYQMESQEDYETRLDTTPYDNHVKAIVAIYNSFLFRQPPNRELGNLASDPGIENFIEDADLDGRSFNALMRDISTYAAVYGNCWVLLDKPAITAATRADEIANGIRPYVSIVTPENVTDWKFQRTPNGYYELTYLKIYEGHQDGQDVFRVYTPNMVQIFNVSSDSVQLQMEMPNALGRIPAVVVYGQRSPTKGIGISLVGDVADMARAVYNELSEIEQVGRLTNHPSLVKTASTAAASGAGSIIQMPEDLQPELKPYLLQPDNASLDGFLKSIEQKIGSIDRMAHMGGIRSIETRRLSGIGLATEFQLLNASLAALADNLEHSEEQIWRLYADWQGVKWDGKVSYPDSFNIQDKYNDMNMLKLAKDAQPKSSTIHKVIEQNMLKILSKEDDYDEYNQLLQEDFTTVQTQPEPSGDSGGQASTQTDSPDSPEEITRAYPDGQPIPDDLPPAYQSSASDGVPEGQACGNCAFNINQMCSRFNNAPIRESWWCLKWEPMA